MLRTFCEQLWEDDVEMCNILFVPDDEKRLVEEVFNNAVDCLSDEDKKLPQVRTTGLSHSLSSCDVFIAIHVRTPVFEPSVGTS